jgi:DNA replication and repair protein RecF
VQTVTVSNYRNLEADCIGLDPIFNVMVGANAQGKTNFLEAIYLVSTSRLLRGRRDSEAIREGESLADVSVQLTDSGTQLSIQIPSTGRKRALLNRVSLPRAADILGRLPAISVTTADLELVRGEPSDRRLQLDLDLSAVSTAYLRDLTKYRKALEQRNALLRRAKELFVPEESFEPWECMMAQSSVNLRRMRMEYVLALDEKSSMIHAEMSSGERLRLEYELNDAYDEEEAFRVALASNRQHDISRGGTSLGPHRDDLKFCIDERDARLFGSQGQQRTAVIALKLAALLEWSERLQSPPMLLLDDMLSDLDQYRRSFLVDVVLRWAGQAVLTCTEASLAGDRVLQHAKVFNVSAGRITPS